jgi:uncharacterized protein YjbI with pentapeptide repeats
MGKGETMANKEQLVILKRGVEVWNEWMKENLTTKVDLRRADLRGAQLRRVELNRVDLRGAHFTGADLRRADLRGANLSEANLNEADLRGADLSGADLRGARLTGADLSKADLRRADLTKAYLIEADLSDAYLSGSDLVEADLKGASLIETSLSRTDLTGADLSGADLSKADLTGADLSEADLSDANLREADLSEAHLSGARLQGTNLSRTRASSTIFGDLDLRQVIGLDDIEHLSPSTIGTNTIARSVGKIPEVFLRGCGLSDWAIEETKLYNPGLHNEEIDKILDRIQDLRANQALQISPLLISYSHPDSEFVDKVGDYLTRKGVRYWRDIHRATAGSIEEQVGRAIRDKPTVLIILSKHSIKSDWVQHELREARKTGIEPRQYLLCPVALDNTWEKSPWQELSMEQVLAYTILDFSLWDDEMKFEEMFRRLIDGLGLFYKGGAAERPHVAPTDVSNARNSPPR